MTVEELEQELEAARFRVKQHEQALAIARELLADYQARHEAAENSWGRTCQQLQARAEFAESRLRAYDAFQLPGADEVVEMSRRLGSVSAPDPLDSQLFADRLEDIIKKATVH